MLQRKSHRRRITGLQIMETKGRRPLRAAGPTARPAAPVEASEPPIVEVTASEAEPLKPAQLPADSERPAAPAVDLVTATAPTTKPNPEPLPKVQIVTAAENMGKSESGAAASLAQSQAALAQGLEALTAELAGLALSGMNVAARTATKLLAVKTIADAIEVNTGFACSSFDTLVGGAAKLSELAMRLVTEVSKPLFGQLARD
jgi:hypothetical protein